MKPHVGLNADYEADGHAYHKLYVDYTRSVEAVGGVPIILPAFHDDEDILSVLATLDALVLTGGSDIDPELYGEKAHPATKKNAAERQWSDLRLAELAMVMEIPILGICLGCQLINVALGGTLIQDIGSENPEALEHSPPADGVRITHTVRIKDGSRLHSIVKADAIEANSTHHQAVKQLGRTLAATARAEDDVIEAVEIPNAWVLGVQWHPERMTDVVEHRALFEALVAAGAQSKPV